MKHQAIRCSRIKLVELSNKKREGKGNHEYKNGKQ